jgi:hypothetical protein
VHAARSQLNLSLADLNVLFLSQQLYSGYIIMCYLFYTRALACSAHGVMKMRACMLVLSAYRAADAAACDLIFNM